MSSSGPRICTLVGTPCSSARCSRRRVHWQVRTIARHRSSLQAPDTFSSSCWGKGSTSRTLVAAALASRCLRDTSLGSTDWAVGATSSHLCFADVEALTCSTCRAAVRWRRLAMPCDPRLPQREMRSERERAPSAPRSSAPLFFFPTLDPEKESDDRHDRRPLQRSL